LGAAVLGSVQVAAYRGGVPPAARASVFDGVALARRQGSAALLGQVRTAFAHGLDSALAVSVAVAVAGVALALVFLPHATPRKEPDSAPSAAVR
jgi:MFS transporter, DHA2 family, multidrug resistance protein